MSSVSVALSQTGEGLVEGRVKGITFCHEEHIEGLHLIDESVVNTNILTVCDQNLIEKKSQEITILSWPLWFLCDFFVGEY